MEELLKFAKYSKERILLRDVLGFGQCNRWLITEDIPTFAAKCFGKDFVIATRRLPIHLIICREYDIIRMALQRIVVVYPGVLSIRHYPDQIGFFDAGKTSLQLACNAHTMHVAQAARHAHLLLDMKADVTGACDELQTVGKLLKRIIRCGGWFQTREAPPACVLYKQQFNVVIVLLGIVKRKRSRLLLRNRITHDLIKVIAKYILLLCG